MKFARRRRTPLDLNLTPLIDVVFLLLIFFMVSTTFTKESQLELELPESDSAKPYVEETISVEIQVNADGSYAINSKKLVNRDLETLIRALREEAGSDTSQQITIRADAASAHQAVVTAMDAAGRAGFANLRIATQQPGTDSGVDE